MTIKPLEWVDIGDKTSTVCVIGIYWFDGKVMCRNGPKLIDGDYHFSVWPIYEGSDIIIAKTAAQADFDALISTALVDGPLYTTGDGIIVGPVWINEIPYVPKSELDKVRAAFADCVVMTDDCRLIVGFETPDKCAAAALTLSEVVG